MHPELMQELNKLHIQELHRGVARHRFAHPRNSIRRLRGRTTRRATDAVEASAGVREPCVGS